MACQDLNSSIEEVWKNADSEVDVDQFLFTAGLVTSFLQNVSQIDPDSFSAFFKNRVSSLYEILKEYEEVVKSFEQRLLILLNSVHTRSKVNKLNSRILYELNVLWNSHDFERDEQLINANRNRVLVSIGVDEGKQMWEKYFKDLDLNQIPWDRFISAYKTFTKLTLTSEEEILLKHILDNDKMSIVAPKEFSRYLRCFGSMKTALNEAKKMYSQVWFHNFMSGEEATRLLGDQAVGTFLVRFSKSRYDVLVLEYVESKNKIRSVPIFIDMPNGVSLKDDNQNEIKFSDIQSLINHHKDTLKYPFQFDLLRRNWYSGSVTTKESEEMLAHNPVGTFMIRLSEEGKFQYIVSYVSRKGINHLLMQKISTGFIVQNSKNFEEDLAWVNSDGIKEMNFPTTGEKKNVVFPSLIIFIRLNPHLKYNYDNEHVPTLKISKLKEAQEAFELDGIHEGSGEGITLTKNNISARSIATYPRNSLGYDIVCDQLFVKTIGNRVIFSLADGCNWGRGPRRAAQNACTAIIEEVANMEVQADIKDTLDIKHLLLRSFSVAHEMIVKSIAETGVFGTTTLVAGVVFEIAKDEWGVVLATVGDCKVFSIGEDVIDITYGNRRNISDARDPGGRLGPYIDENPDLRNLESKFWPLKKGDSLLIVSDGVHDNLDPESSGLMPSDVVAGIENFSKDVSLAEMVQGKRWNEIDKPTAEKLKNRWMVNRIKMVINGKTDAEDAINSLIDYSYELTKKSREFLENNPSKSEPEDQKEYPGKMDHTTGIFINVGLQFESKDLFIVQSQHRGNVRATLRGDKNLERDSSSEDVIVSKPTYSKSLPESYNSPLKSYTSSLFMPPLIVKNTRKDLVKVRKSTKKGLFESIFTRRFNVLSKYLLEPVLNISNANNIIIGNPVDSSKLSIKDLACGQSISTLPQVGKEGDLVAYVGGPCASSFGLDYNPKRISFSVASSPLWGFSHSNASKMAASTFIDNISALQPQIRDVRMLIEAIGASFDNSHEAILSQLDEDAIGSTGMFAGTVCKLKNNNYWMVFVNLGLCKAYVWSDGQVKDLTESIPGIDDGYSGGKIGVCGLSNEPDLKNVEVQFMNVNEGDIIMIMTPAVYHNFDPQILGRQPIEVGSIAETWSEIEELEVTDLKTKARCKEIQMLLSDQLEDPSPSAFCDAIINHCKRTTKKTREYMESSPDEKEPSSFVEYPGKMGHATILSFVVKGEGTLEF